MYECVKSSRVAREAIMTKHTPHLAPVAAAEVVKPS
jgi:hypothetical protein